MRYSAAEKLEIIELVGQSNLPQRRCLASLGIPRQNFYRWYDRYLTGGPEALADKPSRPEPEKPAPIGAKITVPTELPASVLYTGIDLYECQACKMIGEGFKKIRRPSFKESASEQVRNRRRTAEAFHLPAKIVRNMQFGE
jgi:hypothetical protein